MTLYTTKRFFFLCTFAIMTVLIILICAFDKQQWLSLMVNRHSSQPQIKKTSERDTYTKKTSQQEDKQPINYNISKPQIKKTSERDKYTNKTLQQEDKQPINYNISKVGVPCQTPPFMVNLRVPYPPAFSYANSTHLSSNLTMVTGYVNLGKFKKGEIDLYYTNDMYKGWMKRLSKIRNFMVIFVEDNITDSIFREARSYLPSSFTKIIHFKRYDLWGFKLENSIKNIYDAPCYPKFNPNTVKASYSSMTQSKYDLMGMALQKNYFQTKYFGWIDIGYFRDEPENGPPFSLVLPNDFNEERIAYLEVYARQTNVNCQDIVFNNLVWVGGGYFVGRGDVMLAWVTQYQSYVYKMLHSGLMSTAQQGIYCMFNDRQQPPGVKLHLYKAQKEQHHWFTLGYISKRNR